MLPGPITLAYLSFFAAAGLAIKQLAYPLAALATAGSFLPVSPLVAGAYMMWLVAGRVITGYKLAGTFIGLVQAFVAFLLVFGRHGAFNLPLYVATGLTVDLLFLLMGRFARTMPGCVASNAVASLVGTVSVVGIELQMTRLVVLASGIIALGSGAIGGLLAYRLVRFYDSTLGKRYVLDEKDVMEGHEHAR
jgi:hypothetical protein